MVKGTDTRTNPSMLALNQTTPIGITCSLSPKATGVQELGEPPLVLSRSALHGRGVILGATGVGKSYYLASSRFFHQELLVGPGYDFMWESAARSSTGGRFGSYESSFEEYPASDTRGIVETHSISNEATTRSVSRVLRQLGLVGAVAWGTLSSVPSFLGTETIGSYHIRTTSASAETDLPESLQDEQEFRTYLLGALEDESIEDGMYHPAEAILERYLDGSHPLTMHWIQSVFFSSFARRPLTAGALLQLIGRQPYKRVGHTGLALAISGLQSSEVVLRDSAIRALEAWGGTMSLEALRRHAAKETLPYLKTYVEQVISDLAT